MRIGTNVDSGLDYLTSGECNRQFDVVRRVQSVIAVDESLVEIEYYGLLAFVDIKVPS